MEKIQYAFFRVAVLFSGLVFCGGALNDVFGAGDGKPIALDKGMSLTVTVSKAKDEAGEKGGTVCSLRFSNEIGTAACRERW